MMACGVVTRGELHDHPGFLAGVVFLCAGVYWGRMADPTYLSDPSFSEEHDGPLISPDRPSDGRDPSPRQIAAMAAAIRRAYPRRPTGHDPHWHLPTIPRPDPPDGGAGASGD